MSARAPRQAVRMPIWVSVPIGATLIALFFSISVGPVRAFLQWYTWAALLGPIVWVDRRLPIPRDALGRRVAAHIPLSIAWTVVYMAIAQAIDTQLGLGSLRMMSSMSLLQSILNGGMHWNILYYWVLIGGYYAVEYHRESREREQRAAELERLLTEAQLSALRAQLHPHFLFNALNTISAEVERQPKVARRMLEHLGELLRLSLERAQPDKVTLTDELEMLEHYLAIQRARFAGRLAIDVDIDPAARAALVPGLLLQPLVENAIRHGLTPRVQAGRIRVAAHVDRDRLHLAIEDDGVGLPAGWTFDRDAGIGLSTTSRRLETLYGELGSLIVRPSATGGVIADVVLPFQTAQAPVPRESSAPAPAVPRIATARARES